MDRVCHSVVVADPWGSGIVSRFTALSSNLGIANWREDVLLPALIRCKLDSSYLKPITSRTSRSGHKKEEEASVPVGGWRLRDTTFDRGDDECKDRATAYGSTNDTLDLSLIQMYSSRAAQIYDLALVFQLAHDLDRQRTRESMRPFGEFSDTTANVGKGLRLDCQGRQGTCGLSVAE